MSLSLFRISIVVIALVIQLSGCDSGATGSTVVTPSNDNALFVVDSGHGVVAAFPSALPTANTGFTANVLSTQRGINSGIAYDEPRDELYVTAGNVFTSNTIEVFDQASHRSGNITPVRTIIPGIPDLSEIQDLALDKEHDMLYVLVSRTYDGAIAVFNNVSQLKGSVSPTRLITEVGRGNFAIDFKRSILYSKNETIVGGTIHAFSNVDTLNGVLSYANVRMILLRGTLNISGLSVDSVHDRLYAAEEERGVRIIEGASSAGFIYGTVPTFTYIDI